MKPEDIVGGFWSERCGLAAAALAKVRIIGPLVPVLEDQAPDRVGEIYVPESAQARAHSGVVLFYTGAIPAGYRVFFRNYAGTRVSVNGTVVLLLDIEDIIMLQGTPEESISAPSGYLLVEREELPEKSAGGGLFVPHGIRKHTLAAVARVVDVEGIDFDSVRLRPGARVLLSSNAGREIEYQGHTYLRVRLSSVLLVLDEAPAENLGESPLSAVKGDLFEPPKPAAEEGEPEALR